MIYYLHLNKLSGLPTYKTILKTKTKRKRNRSNKRTNIKQITRNQIKEIEKKGKKKTSYLLRFLLLEPLLPVSLALRDLAEDVDKLRELAELDQVEPRDVEDPAERLRLHGFQVEGRASLGWRRAVFLGLL